MELVTMKLSDIVPYENNPRINNQAVEAVKESIRQCGYVAPIIVDEYNVILAGHTRLKALLSMGGGHKQKSLSVVGLQTIRNGNTGFWTIRPPNLPIGILTSWRQSLKVWTLTDSILGLIWAETNLKKPA